MTMSPRPRQRRIWADVLVAAGWVEGTFLVPETQSLLDYLSHGGAFLKMTDARVPGPDRTAEFFALQRAAVTLIAPKVDASPVETEGAGGITSPWSISCLFDLGSLDGRLDFLTNMRLSDYLRQETGFIVVRDAVWTPSAPGADGPEIQAWPCVVVNVARLVGISETEAQPTPGHPRRLPPVDEPVL